MTSLETFPEAEFPDQRQRPFKARATHCQPALRRVGGLCTAPIGREREPLAQATFAKKPQLRLHALYYSKSLRTATGPGRQELRPACPQESRPRGSPAHGILTAFQVSSRPPHGKTEKPVDTGAEMALL